MRIIFALGHPAHFHLFKNVISKLDEKGAVTKILITDKDILKRLLHEHGYSYTVIAPRKNRETILYKAIKIFKSTFSLYKIVKSFKPTLMIGSLTQPSYISAITGIPYIFTGEDDISYTFLQCAVTYPFVSHILAPLPTKVGIFKYKKVPYSGYQKLSYLHPNFFKPSDEVLESKGITKPFYLIRLVNLNAYHDVNIKGLSGNILDSIIKKLEKKGRVFITSEKTLGVNYQKYELPIQAKDIHHLLYYADIYIGDSQSMAVEAAMLGTPSIRFNDFVGKISVLDELEKKYQLTVGIKTNEPEKLLEKVNEILLNPELKNEYEEKRTRMLQDKINVTDFFLWFIENYPSSARIMKENPDYQYNFR